jgi:hypothetical protein
MAFELAHHCSLNQFIRILPVCNVYNPCMTDIAVPLLQLPEWLHHTPPADTIEGICSECLNKPRK